jgi:hypothetical protein
MKLPSSSVVALALALALGLAIAPVARAQVPEIVLQEVNHLLRYIRDSGCDFKRNGSWKYDSKAAEVHVRGKYEFLVRMGRIDTTKDFIDGAASKSSLSGEPYEIRCGGNLPVVTSLWLNDELARYRAAQQQVHSSGLEQVSITR